MPTTQNDINKEEGKGSIGCYREIKAGGTVRTPSSQKHKLQSHISTVMVQFSEGDKGLCRNYSSISAESQMEKSRGKEKKKDVTVHVRRSKVCLEEPP